MSGRRSKIVSNRDSSKTITGNAGNTRENFVSVSNNDSYYSVSNLNSIRSTDSAAVSKPQRLFDRNNRVLNASKGYDNDRDCSFQMQGPLAFSSPLLLNSRVKNEENCTDVSCRSYKPAAYALPDPPKRYSGSTVRNPDAGFAFDTGQPFDRTFFGDSTNILNRTRAAVLPEPGCSRNASDKVRNDVTNAFANNGSVLGRAASGSGLQTSRDHSYPIENRKNVYELGHLDQNDLFELRRTELDAKTFTENFKPILDSLQLATTRLVDKINSTPDEVLNESSRKKLFEIIFDDDQDALQTNDLSAAVQASFENSYSFPVLQEVVTDSDLEAVKALSDKLDYVDKYVVPSMIMRRNHRNKLQKEEKNTYKPSETTVSSGVDRGRGGDDLESDRPADELSDENSLENRSNSHRFRELNKSTLYEFLPITPVRDDGDVDFCNGSLPLNSISLLETAAAAAADDGGADVSADVSNLSIGIDFGVESRVIAAKTTTNRVKPYNLRRRPKPTDHYFASYSDRQRVPVGKKTTRNDNDCHHILVCKGTTRNRKIMRYKFDSETKVTDDPCKVIKKMDKKNNENPSVLDMTCLKLKKVTKPCKCGIFPSQVPATWTDSLHRSLHLNLHKLQFKVPAAVVSTTNVNDKGFLYDILLINTGGQDQELRSTLKNIRDFVDMELDFMKGKKDCHLRRSVFLAVIGTKVIGYLEVISVKKAGVFLNDAFMGNLLDVKFGVSKLWVMVKYRRCGVASKLLRHFSSKRNLQANDIAFHYHGNHGMEFIKKFFANNSALFY